MLLKCNRLQSCATNVHPLHTNSSPSPSLLPFTSKHAWLPRCVPLNSRKLSSCRHAFTSAAHLTALQIVACSASKEEGSNTSRSGPAQSSQSSSKQQNNQRAGTHNGSSTKEQDSAAKGKDAHQYAVHKKRNQGGDSGPGGKSVNHKTDREGEQNNAPHRSSRRQWQGQSGQQGIGKKRIWEGTSPNRTSDTSSSGGSSSSSSGSQSSKRLKTRQTSEKGAIPRTQSGQVPSLHECIRDAKAAGSPQQSYKALYHLGKRVQEDRNGMKKYTGEECEGIVEAAHALAAQMLGMRAPAPLGSNSSTNSASLTISGHTSSPSPILQLDSKQLSLTQWAFSQLVDADSRARSRHLSELLDTVAAHAVGSGVMNTTTDDACMHWSRLLYGIAKMGFSCSNQAVQQLFETGAKLLPQMLHRKQQCAPQNVSNPLWAFATAEYGGSLQQLVSEVASNLEWVMKAASPQNWSNAVWALATLHSQKVVLGEQSTVSNIVSAGVEAMVQQRWRAKPQGLSNTIWALATLDHNPGTATINTLATAMADHSSRAKPQELSNTLWALATLDHNPGKATMNTLATAMAKRSSIAKPQELSNTLWALATLGHNPGTATINTLAVAMAERSSIAKPQELSNTLWALATLDHNPGNATINIFATAMAESSGIAAPQNLSNSLWALAALGHNPGNATINTLATAMAGHSSKATPQNLSNALQALGSLRWYEPEVYSNLVNRLLHGISSSTPDAVGQHFSNALFSCALCCHFDSSVDALAAWGSQVDSQQWTEQEISNTLFAWAILTATAGRDTGSMRALARHLFQEASRRGAARFTVDNDLGKLYSAHQEAVHTGMPKGGLADPQLLQVVTKHFRGYEQSFDERDRRFTSIIATALQGHHEVQAATVMGYNTRLVLSSSCPHGIAIVVTQRVRDYLSHPADQLYGKTALRLKHIERNCDGLVLCDESEVKGSSNEQRREMLLERIEQVVGNQKQV